MSQAELVARLNDVGYAQRTRVERSGDFAIDRHTVVLLSRGGDQAGKVVTVSFPEPPIVRKKTAKPPPPPPQRIVSIKAVAKNVDRVTLDAPVLTGMMTGSREKRRRVALDVIPARMQEAVLAIEDRCSHEDFELSAGAFDAAAASIECVLHGARFDVRDGRALCPPAYEPVAKFPVRVDDTGIWTRDDRG